MWNVEPKAMSEFKYACPVCGQHIKCDATQSGSVMECPTCLQKIIAPQAPASPDQKFILSGKKVSEPPKTRVVPASPFAPTPAPRGFPLAAVALVVLIVCTAAATTVLIIKRSKSTGHPAPPPPPAVAQEPPGQPVPEPVAETPSVVIPHASDTNWTLSLDTVTFPDTPAAGRIHGQDFLCERASLQGGALTLRQGTKGPLEFALIINFTGARPETLADRNINIPPNAPVAAHVTLRWTAAGQVVKDNLDTGYALRIQFGALNNNRLPGKIYFCAPDDTKSYVAGAFTAEVRKLRAPKPKPAN
jgi:DNA-directed RNA polymerase subunit RPC12/RpoP